MAVVRVSPNFTSEKLASGKLEDRIDVFEDRLRGWFLTHARALLNVVHGDLAALQLALGYFETYAIYWNGEDSEGKSKQFFTQAFLEVFPFSGWEGTGVAPALPPDFRQRLAGDFYRAVRCGLFHSGMTGYKILVGRKRSQAIEVSVHKPTGATGAIVVDPEKLLDEVDAHFAGYLAQLRAPANTELRERFSRAWELKNPMVTLPVPPTG